MALLASVAVSDDIQLAGVSDHYPLWAQLTLPEHISTTAQARQSAYAQGRKEHLALRYFPPAQVSLRKADAELKQAFTSQICEKFAGVCEDDLSDNAAACTFIDEYPTLRNSRRGMFKGLNYGPLCDTTRMHGAQNTYLTKYYYKRVHISLDG